MQQTQKVVAGEVESKPEADEDELDVVKEEAVRGEAAREAAESLDVKPQIILY
jgi:hypothetical protein